MKRDVGEKLRERLTNTITLMEMDRPKQVMIEYREILDTIICELMEPEQMDRSSEIVYYECGCSQSYPLAWPLCFTHLKPRVKSTEPSPNERTEWVHVNLPCDCGICSYCVKRDKPDKEPIYASDEEVRMASEKSMDEHPELWKALADGPVEEAPPSPDDPRWLNREDARKKWGENGGFGGWWVNWHGQEIYANTLPAGDYMYDALLIPRNLPAQAEREELFRFTNDEVDKMLKERDEVWRDLVHHIWVHSGYKNNGYAQMTSNQKALYDSVIEKET